MDNYKPSISYTVMARKNPITDVVEYYPRKQTYSRILMPELVDRIYENTQVQRGQIHAAISAIVDSVNNFVLNGHSVKLGDLMCLRPVVKALKNNGQPSADLVEARYIAPVKLVATWGNLLRKYQKPENYNFVKLNYKYK